MLTNRLAFLIQLDNEADPADGGIEGRVEHIVSGERIDFHDAATLLQFLAEARVMELSPPGDTSNATQRQKR